MRSTQYLPASGALAVFTGMRVPESSETHVGVYDGKIEKKEEGEKWLLDTRTVILPVLPPFAMFKGFPALTYRERRVQRCQTRNIANSWQYK